MRYCTATQSYCVYLGTRRRMTDSDGSWTLDQNLIPDYHVNVWGFSKFYSDMMPSKVASSRECNRLNSIRNNLSCDGIILHHPANLRLLDLWERLGCREEQCLRNPAILSRRFNLSQNPQKHPLSKQRMCLKELQEYKRYGRLNHPHHLQQQKLMSNLLLLLQ